MLDYQGANQQPQDKPDRLGLTMAFAHPEFLVATDWLAERLADDDVRVFETTVFLHPRDGGGRRNESGRMEYESGQIPGAPNVPSMELTDSETGLYRPAEEPALLFQQAGADRTQRVITYCGGGIAASNDAFVLAMLG